MIDIIFLAVIAGVLIIRLLMVLGEKRDDDPTPPFSLLDATKKQAKTLGQAAGERDAKAVAANPDAMPVAEVVEPEPTGFYLKPNAKAKEAKQEGKGEKKSGRNAVIEDSQNPRWAAAWPGIMAIKARDDNFFANDFLQGAENAFEVVLDCFVRGDNDKNDKGKSDNRASQLLKEYVAPDLLTGFIDAIKEREKKGYHQEHKNLIGIRHSTITEAAVDERNKTCQVKVLFESDQIYALYDKDNKLVEGDDSTIIPKKDTWVFERKLTMGDNSRWWLVAVEE
ncbi:MAG: Tim44/TimA family putative adaptor protein [Hydrotalea sp.]|nr:Tim44/TimA family putative adaptor protein [Hydrotalea sp.]